MIADRTAFALFIFVLLLGAACATGISKQARSQVTHTEGFSVLQKDPTGHLGEVVMLGGKILESKASPASSEIALLQMPLGPGDRPEDGDRSEGRFLLRSAQFLDPAIYRSGMILSAVGKITGSEVRPIGGLDYVYPIVEAIEIKLWPERSPGYPAVHFGVGVGVGF